MHLSHEEIQSLQEPPRYRRQVWLDARDEVSAGYVIDPDGGQMRVVLGDIELRCNAGTAEYVAKSLLDAMPDNLLLEMEETLAQLRARHARSLPPLCSICRARHGVEIQHAAE